MKVAIVYDQLYPYTIGGFERHYHDLATRLAAHHDVTYLTRSVWGEEAPRTRYRVAAVGPGGRFYTAKGRRGIWPPVRFGLGLFWHLLRHAGRYDVVHTGSFPYFSVLAAWAALRLRGRRSLIVEWAEFWPRSYWRSYLGPFKGSVGNVIQTLCLRATPHVITFSALTTERIRERRSDAQITRITGMLDEIPQPADVAPDPAPTMIFAGRHIREKGVGAIPAAIAQAVEDVPDLRCVIYGTGPETERLRDIVRDLGLERTISIPGVVDASVLAEAMSRATCLLFPSSREGYGLVVAEALARGTPAIVVDAPDNASTDLIVHGTNGLIVPDTKPETLAKAIVEVVRGREDLRRSTASWLAVNGRSLALDGSMPGIEAAYERAADRRSTST